jgi:cell division transport system permease protein
MIWRKFTYCLKGALRNVWRNFFTNLITIGTISISLLILSIFLFLNLNVKEIIHTFGDRIHITLYLNDDLTEAEIHRLIKQITPLREIGNLTFISRDNALRELKRMLKNQDGILDNLSPNPLPNSLEIKVKREYQNSASIENLVERLRKYQGINDIEYGDEWVRKFTTIFSFFNLIGVLMTGLITIATVFIISNTIKLSIYSRSDEIEIMRLVGATNLFIKFPFFLEGFLQGTLGSLIAIGLLFTLYRISTTWLTNHRSLELSFLSLTFLPQDLIWMIIFSGALLGALGSVTSLGRFLRV